MECVNLTGRKKDAKDFYEINIEMSHFIDSLTENAIDICKTYLKSASNYR